jgi:haloalkane dehalogenase
MDTTLPKSVRAHYPFRNRFLELSSGSRLHYVDEGRENLTLLLHDIPLWSFYFRNLIAELRGQFRCLAPDYLGFGLSAKPKNVDYSLRTITENTIELLTQLNVGKFNLILHGWGAVPGMVVATRWPERVNRIVLLNANCFPKYSLPLSHVACRIGGLGRLAVTMLNLPVVGASLSANIGSHSRAGYRFPHRSWSSRYPVRTFIGNLPMGPHDRDGKWLATIAEKIFILAHKKIMAFWGLADKSFSARTLDLWQAEFEEMKVHTFPGTGRYALEDEFDTIFPLLKRFLVGGIEVKIPAL